MGIPMFLAMLRTGRVLCRRPSSRKQGQIIASSVRHVLCTLLLDIWPILKLTRAFLSDLIKYDTPYLGPKIQLMLSQLEFKLSVEKQYKAGIEKMVRLYQDDGDRKSRSDAEGRRIESNQKIQLLKQSLKRYEDLHVDMESADGPDGIFCAHFIASYLCVYFP